MRVLCNMPQIGPAQGFSAIYQMNFVKLSLGQRERFGENGLEIGWLNSSVVFREKGKT